MQDRLVCSPSHRFFFDLMSRLCALHRSRRLGCIIHRGFVAQVALAFGEAALCMGAALAVREEAFDMLKRVLSSLIILSAEFPRLSKISTCFSIAL